jgi:hypothetical protein
MPDITLCTGEGCPMRAKCYRHTAQSSKYAQSYFVTPPMKDGKCDSFWPVEKEKVKTSKKKS